MAMALGYEYNCTKAHNEAFSLRDPEVFGTNGSDLNPGTPGHMVNRLGICLSRERGGDPALVLHTVAW